MGVVTDTINEQQAKNAGQTQQQQGQVATTSTTGPTAQPTGGSVTLDPVLDVEKTDAMFWLDVATVVLLFLIWRELRGA